MNEWPDQLTPTPVGENALRVLLLVLGPEMEEVRAALTGAMVRLRCKEEIDEVADPRAAQPEEVLVVPQMALPRLGQLPKGARWEGARPVLAICPSASVSDLSESLGSADDAIPWPDGADRLLGRLARLTARARAQRDASLLQRQVGALIDLSEHLVSRVERDLLYPEAVERIKTWVGGDRVFMMTVREDGSLMKLADTDEPGVTGVPLTLEEVPELARVMAEDKTVLYLGPQQEKGEGELSRCLGDGSIKAALVVPLRWEGEVTGALEAWFDADERVDAVNRTFLKRLAMVLAVNLRGCEVFGRMEGQTNLTTFSADEEATAPPLEGPFKEYFQRTLDGIMVLGPDGNLTHLNDAGEQITGYSSVGIQALTLEEIVVEQDRAMLGRMLERMRRDGDAPAFDLGLMTTSGDTITLAMSPNAVLLNEGVVVFSFRDVTEARALEEDLRSTKEFLERLIDSTADGIIVTGARGEVVLFNKGAERIFGLDPAEVRGRALAEVLGDPRLLKKFDDLQAGRASLHGRLEPQRSEVRNPAGETVPVSVSASRFTGEGQEAGIVISVRDLSERMMMAESLAQAEEKLAETEKQVLLAELAGTTAHELNQPLTSIMGYSELLKRRMPSEDPNVRSVEILMSEAERMADIVRKIGKITRYETKSYVGAANILDLDKASEEE